MENKAGAGCFSASARRISQQIIGVVRHYHGYIFAWATVYTFWYHPMVNTSGHLIGFLYMFLLLLQGSLFFTRVHVNRWWTLMQEVTVTDPRRAGGGDAGQRHLADVLFGFGGIFVITQMHGLGLPRWARFGCCWAFTSPGRCGSTAGAAGRSSNEIIRIPLIEYLAVIVLALIFGGGLWVARKCAGPRTRTRNHRSAARPPDPPDGGKPDERDYPTVARRVGVIMELLINGQVYTVAGEPDRILLGVLRDELGPTGTKFGCGIGMCGSCTVLVDGEPTRSCVTPVSAVAGKAILTLEGLAQTGPDGAPILHPVQRAFEEEQVHQCGYCMTGQMLTAVALLRSNPGPARPDSTGPWHGFWILCRCGAYPRIKRAVARAAEIADQEGGPDQRADRRNRCERAHRDSQERPPDHPPSVSYRGRGKRRSRPGGVRVLGLPYARLQIADYLDSSGGPPIGVKATPTAWFEILPDNTVRLFLPKVEMGQGVHTALAQAAADELEAAWENLEVLSAATGQGLDDPVGTSASNSVSSLYMILRQAGATVRQMLRAEGARQLGRPVEDTVAEQSYVYVAADPQVRRSYGEIIAAAPTLTVPEQPAPLKADAALRYIGQPMPRVDLRAKVLGQAIYGIDVRLPGMAYGAVAHPPTVEGKLKRASAGQAESMPGVVKVVIDEKTGFAGVVAESREQAYAAVGALDLKWDAGHLWQQAEVEQAVTAGGAGGVVIQQEGTVRGLLRGAAVEAEFACPWPSTPILSR